MRPALYSKCCSRLWYNFLQVPPTADRAREAYLVPKALQHFKSPRRQSHTAPAAPAWEWSIDDQGVDVKTGSTRQDNVIIGIDPDNHGAVAVIRVQQIDSSALSELDSLAVKVYDIPLEKVHVGKRIRNQADTAEAVTIIREIVSNAQAATQILAYLEEPIPNPRNGLISVLGTGFSYGVWKGILAAHDIPLTTCSARRWKGDLGLLKAGKEGSRLLALQLFPEAQELLKRKKDHGRAEALLIVAWALGIRLPNLAVAKEESIDTADSIGSLLDEEPLNDEPVSTVIDEGTVDEAKDSTHEATEQKLVLTT